MADSAVEDLPHIAAWREAFRAGRPPTSEEIGAARRCVGYQLVELRPPNEVRFLSDCLALDLGGIGKGYAVDAAVTALKAAGKEVNARIYKDAPGGHSFDRIDTQVARQARQEMFAWLEKQLGN